jgi:hypothetical protein
MEDEYQRGDIFKKLTEVEQKLTPEEIIARGNVFEDFIKSKGWKYLSEWINRSIEFKRALLESYNARTIDEINDIRTSMSVYKLILNKPIEYIKKKNNLVEKIEKENK